MNVDNRITFRVAFSMYRITNEERGYVQQFDRSKHVGAWHEYESYFSERLIRNVFSLKTLSVKIKTNTEIFYNTRIEHSG